nr:hypothetical protein [Bacteroidota bacterium]
DFVQQDYMCVLRMNARGDFLQSTTYRDTTQIVSGVVHSVFKTGSGYFLSGVQTSWQRPQYLYTIKTDSDLQTSCSFTPTTDTLSEIPIGFEFGSVQQAAHQFITINMFVIPGMDIPISLETRCSGCLKLQFTLGNDTMMC